MKSKTFGTELPPVNPNLDVTNTVYFGEGVPKNGALTLPSANHALKVVVVAAVVVAVVVALTV